MANRASGPPGGGSRSNKVVDKPVRIGKSARQVHQGGAGARLEFRKAATPPTSLTQITEATQCVVRLGR
jgi:hypothetical protein